MANGSAASSTADFARTVDEVLKSGKGLNEENLQKIAQEFSRLFSVKLDEVALLELSHDSAVLHFLYPLKLRKVGSIPMSTTNSLAVRTARDKRPEMINNFSSQKHPTIFESVDLQGGNQERHPIQKIMSVPLLLDSKSIGVVQISRKGKSPLTAGADFSIRDLTALMSTAGVLAKCFKK